MTKTGKNSISRAKLKLALAASASAAAFAIAGAAFAQADDVARVPEAADDRAPTTRDEVVVTGSRIRRDEFSSSGPVQVINPELGELQGTIDAASLIQSSSVASGSAQTSSAISSTFVTNGGAGAATISLRGLGAERTLVLLNSRRAGPAGTRGAVSSFDLNVLPTSIISNIEILKDGASSIYGSDAVAGVVNILTKRDTDGIEFDFFGTQPFDSGGEEYRGAATWGKTFDRGHILISGDYYKRKELARGDRRYLECGEERIFDAPGGNRVDLIDPRTGQFKCSDDAPWGHIWIYDLHYYDYLNGFTGNNISNIPPTPIDPSTGLPWLPGDRFGRVTQFQYNYAGDNLQNHIPGLPAPRDASDLSVPAGYFPVAYDPISTALFNEQAPFVPEVTVIPETTRYTAYFDAAFELTDNIEIYGEFLFNRRETYQNGYRQFWTFGLANNASSLDCNNVDPSFQFGCFGFSNPFDLATGPYLTSATPVTNHSDSSQKVDYFRGVGGIKGEFAEGGLAGWQWDVYSQYSRSKGLYTNDQIYQDAIDYQYAIGYGYFPTGCEGTTTPISGTDCVTINWWDPEFLRGNIPQAARDHLFGTETGKTIYTQFYLEGILSGNVVELPAGPLGLAVGTTWRRDEIDDTPGEITFAPDPNNPGEFVNNAWGSSASGHTFGSSKTLEFFGEMNIPLLRDKPFIEYFELNVAGRWTDVSTVGSDETWKVSANWTVTDWLRLGGTIGTSFRAPALFELFLADQTSSVSQRTIDPCVNWGTQLALGNISQQLADNCAAQGVPPNHGGGGIGATVITGGGLGVLSPETSKAKTASVTLTLDKFLPESTNLSIRGDFFDIEVNGEIAQLGAGSIVGGCLNSDFFPTDPLCDLFERNGQGNPNNISFVRDSFINVNSQRNRGVDLTVRLDQELPGNLGSLEVTSQMTWQLKDTIALFEGTVENLNGEEGEPKFTGDLNVVWNKDDWKFLWSIDYFGSTSDLEDFTNATGSVDGCGVTDIAHVGPYCVDIVAERKIYNSASISKSFNDDQFQIIFGVANIFDTEPPRISEFGTNRRQVTNVGAVPFQSQYDFVGRRAFLNLKASF